MFSRIPVVWDVFLSCEIFSCQVRFFLSCEIFSCHVRCFPVMWDFFLSCEMFSCCVRCFPVMSNWECETELLFGKVWTYTFTLIIICSFETVSVTKNEKCNTSHFIYKYKSCLISVARCCKMWVGQCDITIGIDWHAYVRMHTDMVLGSTIYVQMHAHSHTLRQYAER